MWFSSTLLAVATAVALLMGSSAAVPYSETPGTKAAEGPSAGVGTVRSAPRAADPDAVARDTEEAKRVLAELATHYELLEGVTVRVARTPEGHEAVAYYAKGEIVVSDVRTVPIDRILAHEIWHVIDWRDDGRLDWGEDLPPANASDYLIR